MSHPEAEVSFIIRGNGEEFRTGLFIPIKSDSALVFAYDGDGHMKFYVNGHLLKIGNFDLTHITCNSAELDVGYFSVSVPNALSSTS